MTDKIAYKVLTADEWTALTNDRFQGSPIDQVDGFIHLSTAMQLGQTVERHFRDQKDLVIATIDLAALGGSVRWEASRHGQLFPHVYAALRTEHVIACRPFTKNAAGALCPPLHSEFNVMTFTDLRLPPNLVAALLKQAISDPTSVQTAAIPPLVAGKDAYLRAETGTGKTLAYLLPIFTRIDPAQVATQVVIVAPTHELAIQIHRQSCELAVNASLAIRSVLLIGGTATNRQIDKLKAKPHVVVGSPGRIVELIERGKLNMLHIRAVIIDEADRLLNDESLEWVRKIVGAAPSARQLIFASATIEQQTRQVLEAMAPGLVMIRTGAAPVNKNIEHLYLVCESRDKPDLLRKMLHAFNVPRSIVFVHRNDVAADVASKLTHHKLTVADLNSELSKADRKLAMNGIRSGAIRILIASDLAARGLDLPDVTHIFNLDVPTMSKAYLHRVGRTARAGAQGTAVSLVTETEARLIRRYEQDLAVSISQIRLRDGEIRRESMPYF